MIWELNKYYKIYGKNTKDYNVLIVKPTKYLGCDEKGVDEYECKILYDNDSGSNNWQGKKHSIHPEWWNFVKINREDALSVAL